MTRIRTVLCALAVVSLGAFVRPGLTQAGKSAPPYPAHLPYSFSNFAWWTDDELRSLLKKRIPGLGDEVATTTEAEGRIRDALTALLREKGIAAEVQSEEPSPSALQPPPPNVFGNVEPDDTPPVPKPSIAFLLFRPEIRVGKLTVQASADDARQAIESGLEGFDGKQFTEGILDFEQFEAAKYVKRLGYYGSQVQFHHAGPYKDGDHFLVDVSVTADAGPKYHISAISTDGGPLFEGRDLSQFLTARVGDPAWPGPFLKIGPGLRAAYESRGYAGVRIEANPTLDRDHATVAYALRVVPGPVYHLRNLTIQKLNAAQEKRVREVFDMKPGDLYRDRAINDLYHAIADEPLLKGYTFAFSPKRDQTDSVVDLTLEFSREGGQATVTVK